MEDDGGILLLPADPGIEIADSSGARPGRQFDAG